jgi:hypothetical protein
MNTIDEIISDHSTCESSRRALSTPREFLLKEDRAEREARRERRKFLAEPELMTGFGIFLPVGPFLPSDRARRQEPVAAVEDLANRSAL